MISLSAHIHAMNYTSPNCKSTKIPFFFLLFFSGWSLCGKVMTIVFGICQFTDILKDLK
jgi:hypothetical protein